MTRPHRNAPCRGYFPLSRAFHPVGANCVRPPLLAAKGNRLGTFGKEKPAEREFVSPRRVIYGLAFPGCIQSSCTVVYNPAHGAWFVTVGFSVCRKRRQANRVRPYEVLFGKSIVCRAGRTSIFSIASRRISSARAGSMSSRSALMSAHSGMPNIPVASAFT